jgi:hypothetical protein
MDLATLFSWWTGSALQIGILVSLFWLALIVCILALVGSNRRSEEPLHPVTADHAAKHVPLEDAYQVDDALRRGGAI